MRQHGTVRIRGAILGILTSVALLCGLPSFSDAAGFDLRVNWTNPPVCNPVGSLTPAGCDNAATQKIEIGTAVSGSPTNYALVPGSPFPASLGTLNFTALPAGVRQCIRWTRITTGNVLGDPFEMCGTPDAKPGQPGSIQFIFTPNLSATPPPAAAPARAPQPKKP